MTLTDEQLDAIEARTAAAMPGPWRWQRRTPNMDGANWDLYIEGQPGIRLTTHQYHHGHDLAEFITNARTDIPLLLAEVRRLRKERSQQ